jgi:hypothetical protein
VKITIESTSKLVELRGQLCSVPARVWEGQTEKGVRVVAFVTRITPLDGDSAEFDADLNETRVPSPDVQAWPTRLVL